MFRIAVTGATGFIGRSLVERLDLHREVDIVRVVRNAVDVRGPDCVPVGDIDGNTEWTQALSGVDTVVHLAARAHVIRKTSADPDEAFHVTNVAGSRRLAEEAVAANVKHLIFVSSIGVNGSETLGTPFTECQSPNPEAAYARSKLEAEQQLQAIALKSSMALTIVRPPLVYGPDAPGNFGRLKRLVQTGLPLPFASLCNQRSLISRTNLVDFIMTCIQHQDARGETFVVSDDDDCSTPQLVRTMAEQVGQTACLVHVPPKLLTGALALVGRRALERQLCGSLQIDITKARTMLGWRPPQTFAEGIREAMVPGG